MNILVTDRNGLPHQLQPGSDGILMHFLHAENYGISAVCGGAMACGTCHIYVADQDFNRLPPPSPEERKLLETLSNVKQNSRLSCQIYVTSALGELALTIAPEE